MSEPGLLRGAGNQDCGKQLGSTPGGSPMGQGNKASVLWLGLTEQAAQEFGPLVGPLSRAELGPDPAEDLGWSGDGETQRLGAEQGIEGAWSCSPGGSFCSCPGLGSAWSQLSLQEGGRGRGEEWTAIRNTCLFGFFFLFCFLPTHEACGNSRQGLNPSHSSGPKLQE